MLTLFLYTLRAYKIPVGTQEWLMLMDALSQQLIDNSLDRLYQIARAILVKSEALYDAYDQAFLACFKEHTTLNIKEELLTWLDRTVAELPALPPGLETLDLEELRKRFLERLEEQKEEHHGGNRWIGTGGTSPFGHSGRHPSGIRVGGEGHSRSAMQVAAERRFQNYRHDRILDTRQFQVALKRLRQLDSVGPRDQLDLEASIHATCKNAGDIELVFAAEEKNQTELLLLMDVGGSMTPYAELLEALFSAAHASQHFKAFHYYFFHNCIYSEVFSDMNQRQAVPLEELFRRFRKSFNVLCIGDACMNPYELFARGGHLDYWTNNETPGLEWLQRLRQHYPRSAWLNPEPSSYWQHPTIRTIGEVFPMYPLSVEGLSEAIDQLRANHPLTRQSQQT